MMENNTKIIQHSAYYSNQYNSYPISTNLININSYNSFRNQTNYNKPQPLKINFENEKNISKTNKLKYNLNYSNSSHNSIDKLSTNNIDEQSNKSNQTIKSIVNNINYSNKEISFKHLKNKINPSDSLNNSKISHDGNSYLKYGSTNSSFINNNENNKTRCLYSPGVGAQYNAYDNKQVSLMIKEKIENAKINEEILLPPIEINLDGLNILKPVKIKGQANSRLHIHEGQILIDFESFNKINNNNNINNNSNNDIVKFCQMQVIYNDNKVNKEKKITNLFKIHPSSFLVLEDCDIVFQNKNHVPIPTGRKKISDDTKDKKSVAFLLLSNKKKDNSKRFNPSILTLTNTRIHNFYQSIRAGQNCTIYINKSAFIQNYGKAIVMINPIFLKISDTLFENNEDNSIHIKFLDDCLYEEKRKLFFNKNEFDKTIGNNICIEGVKNKKLDLSLVLTKNSFNNSITDGVLIYDLIYNYFEITDNVFKKNNGNGLNIQKSFFNEILCKGGIITTNNNSYQPIKIKNNKFIENIGFGLFINDCIIEVISNKFNTNKQSGMILCNIIIDDPLRGLEGINRSSIKGDFQSILKSVKKSNMILKNSFYENGQCGLYIYGYPYQVIVQENVFTSNCRHGITIDLDCLYNNSSNNIKKDFRSKLNEYKSITQVQKINELANIIINNCIIEKNLKSGLSLNSCLLYIEETFIINNLSYAISIKKEEYKNCFKQGKNNTINGSLGGDWGEINLDKDAQCGFSCMPKSERNYKKKEEIIKKVPSYFDQSEDIKSLDDGIQRRNDFSLKKSENVYMKRPSAPNNKINKDNSQNDNEDDGGCFIF